MNLLSDNVELTCDDALDAWNLVLKHLLSQGVDFMDDDGRVCREMLRVSVSVNDSTTLDAPIDLLRKSKKWFYPRKDELLSLMFSKQDLPLYAYTYGSRLFNYAQKIDQLGDYIIPLLKQNPISRRACATLLDPTTDSIIDNRYAPAITSIHCNIAKGLLHLTAVIRSNDFFIGWPANVYQLGALHKSICKEINVGVGVLTTYSLSAHIFLEYASSIQDLLAIK